ncbi:RBR-type E3 ubiquitin transferase [Quillaja saponaria]|uniref:RBR-type E3 ubiquitin transferase n=1 Tax=Quillaja saponaria TaxID=32244 RepID=A0AAD7PGU4_QUISA|nr:RBR-type E3 ubiquitin transferase [Quillaja saponaria]
MNPMDYFSDSESLNNSSYYNNSHGLYVSDYDEDDSISSSTSHHHVKNKNNNFSFLKESDILRLQEDDISRVSSALAISPVVATILLVRFNWNVCETQDAWFSNQDTLAKSVGLLENPNLNSPINSTTCGICFESFSFDGVNSAACGHPYCTSCWKSYISVAIDSGPGCLTLKCPQPSCVVFVGKDMIDLLGSQKEKDKYQHYLLRSYVEQNKKIKWCPSPGCEYAVKSDDGNVNYDLSCLCSFMFCWNCSEDAHRPVNCDTVAKWVLKNTSEAENTKWISAYCKPCPKCKRPIEKNHGCNHMTCTHPCYFQFCWICFDKWSEHRSCNSYLQSEELKEEEKQRRKVKAELRRYSHYYERWANNEHSRQKAISDFRELKRVQLEKLTSTQSQTESQLNFITEAWQQIVECRRVLKWSYAYGYYLSNDVPLKKQFFEYLQGQAEMGLERLHQCAEEELKPFITAEKPSIKEFLDYKGKLATLTQVTKNYFVNLVGALENGLSEVY